MTESANKIFAQIFNPLHDSLKLKSKAYIDLTGRFPYKSSRGNSYIFFMVPPHQHRRNVDEKAIRTFKNHLLSGLATCDKDFPILEWDRLLPQCEMTLNLLRSSRINPRLSSWAPLNGNHHFNKSPLAPPGTKILVHKKPQDSGSLQFHGTEGWYIGPALHHYRCLTCYLPITRTEIISNIVRLIPRHIQIPEINIKDYLGRGIQ